MQALITSYIADRDSAIAEFNECFMAEKLNIQSMKAAIDKMQVANAAIKDVSEMWRSMIAPHTEETQFTPSNVPHGTPEANPDEQN